MDSVCFGEETLDGGLGDLVERLTLEEILSGQPATPESVSQLCREAAVLFERNIKALDEMVGKITKMKLSEKITHRMMAEAMLPLNPKVLPLTDSLNYEFDFGDGWEISIALCDVYDNDNTGDEKLSAQVKQVMETGRPLCIAMDGNLPLVQDVGGIHDYCDFLKTINGKDSDTKKEMLVWAGPRLDGAQADGRKAAIRGMTMPGWETAGLGAKGIEVYFTSSLYSDARSVSNVL